MFLKLFYPSYIDIPHWRKEEQSPLHGAAQYVPEIKTSYATWFENTKEDNIRKIIIQSLSEFPHRGNYPRELLLLGIREYRETFFKPYRVIYRVIDESVYILCTDQQ